MILNWALLNILQTAIIYIKEPANLYLAGLYLNISKISLLEWIKYQANYSPLLFKKAESKFILTI